MLETASLVDSIEGLDSMNQLVSVYLKQECFLLLPSSLIGQHGPWISHQPGVGISSEADDAALGQMILFVRSYSTCGLPPRDLREPLPFPLSSLAGLKSWGTLARSSPIMANVNFTDEGIAIERSAREGLGHSVDPTGSVRLPIDTSAAALGAVVRRLFAPAA